MSLTNLHLILNHLTIVGVPIATVFLLHGLVKGNLASRRFALIILFILSAVVLPVYFTGEPAEESVEHLPGVVESMIETHEDAGKVSMIITVILGVFSLGALWFQRDERRGRSAAVAVLVLAVIAIGSLTYTGSLGGKIRHTEIRSGAEASSDEAGGEGAGGQEKEKEKEGESESADD